MSVRHVRLERRSNPVRLKSKPRSGVTVLGEQTRLSTRPLTELKTVPQRWYTGVSESKGLLFLGFRLRLFASIFSGCHIFLNLLYVAAAGGRGVIVVVGEGGGRKLQEQEKQREMLQ